MITQERINGIIGELKVLSGITPGKTLSPTTMTIVDHDRWMGSVWRTYAGENRTQTIIHIRGILLEALSVVKIIGEKENKMDIIVSIETALHGIGFMKETYKDDYYVIAEIDGIIKSTREALDEIREYIENPYKGYNKIYLSEVNSIEEPSDENNHSDSVIQNSDESTSELSDIKMIIDAKKENLKQRRDNIEKRKSEIEIKKKK